jgi:AcrR family transcriptional regulator
VTTPALPAGRPGLREQKKQRTRAAIQDAALELIVRQGYDATTCEQIAAAAEVSPATFFRYVPTKEDVVLQDDYDPLMAAAVAARPARERPFQAVRRALAETLAQLPENEMTVVHERTRLLLSVPALRARVHEQTETARGALAAVLATRLGRPTDDLAVQAIAAACAAAVSVGVERWARDGGRLSDHIDTALAALQ